ncbi:MAG: carboxypeptidase M32, partial [Dehalococcoidales bacterium]|nr:carboxypeptidase M32 [Dehalococcoidales bacterium]
MQENISRLYSQLLGKYRETAILSTAAGVLSWDMMTKMPPRGINLRSQQLAVLSGTVHRMVTDREIGMLLRGIENDPEFANLDAVQKRNVHLIHKGYDEQSALPESLVIEMQRQGSIANDTWRKAKLANDWKMFYPELEKNIELTRRAADILKMVKRTETPYDALIDIYEPGMTARHIDLLFGELRDGLISLIDKIKQAPVQADLTVLRHKVPVDLQRRIAITLAETIGYDVTSDKASGRIDETEHPFTSGYFDDVRVTTHYYEDHFASSIFSILHEVGHALYEMDINPEWMFQPVGSACSTGIHESQSRLVENIIGRSAEFWAYFLPRLKEITDSRLPEINLEQFLLAVNHVEPSRIRIEADEVTYCLHVIIRFDIEKGLFAGQIQVKDLPEIWNQSYKKYLGVDIENYAEGVMQDMHWSAGNFGYFPC